MLTIVDHAVQRYRRRSFPEGLNQDFGVPRFNEKEWGNELTERALWENTNTDGNYGRVTAVE